MEVHYKEGQMVHKGDPLLEIDPRPYQAALTQVGRAVGPRSGYAGGSADRP